MSQWRDIPLATQEGQTATTFVSDAELQNLMLVPNPPGSSRPFAIVNTPAYGTDIIAGSGFLRGAIAHNGGIYYVRGTTAYYWNGSSTTTLTGSVTGSGYVKMVAADKNRVLVLDYDSGALFIASTTAVASVTVNSNETGYRDIASLDGYAIAIGLGGGALVGDEWYISDLDDPTTWTTLQFSTADAVPDRLVSVVVANRSVYLFGRVHTEIWTNTGASPFPFERAQPGVLEFGAYGDGRGAKSAVVFKDAIYIPGTDRRYYRISGYDIQRISTPWVERLLAAQTFPYLLAGVYVTADGAYLVVGSGGFYTLVYDIGTGLWHRRVDPTNHGFLVDAFTLASSPVDAQNGKSYAAINVSSSGKIVEISDSLFRNSFTSSTDFSRVITLPAVDGGGPRIFEAANEILMAQTSGAAGTVRFDYSDDGGANYKSHGANTVSALQAISTDQSPIRWARCGSYRRRIHRYTITANARIAIEAVRHRVSVGIAS